MTLSIYSETFDSNENVINNGFNNHVFIEDNKTGKDFTSLNAAIDFIIKNNINITDIIFYYKDIETEMQMFKKFKVQ